MDICDFGWLGNNQSTAVYFRGESTATRYGRIARSELKKMGIDSSKVYALAYSKTAWTVSVNSVKGNCKFLLIQDQGTQLHIWLLDHGFWNKCQEGHLVTRDKNDPSNGYYLVSTNKVTDYLSQGSKDDNSEDDNSNRKIWEKTVSVSQKEFIEALGEAVRHLKAVNGGNS